MLASVALTGAVLLQRQIADAQTRITESAAVSSRHANGGRMLSNLLLNATASVDTGHALRGDSVSVSFWSICPTSGGWAEPCHVTLAIDRQRDTSVVVAVLQSGETFALRRDGGAPRFRYLERTASDSSWRTEWKANVTLPAAIGLVLEQDTVLFPVGGPRD